MKKVLLILFITLFNTSLFAEINEPGSGKINYWSDFEKYYKEELKKSQKKKQKLIIYGSTSTGGWATGTSITKEINDKSHKKAYKRCMKFAKKYTQKDCYLFAIDDEVVWNFDAVVVKKTIYNTDLSELPIGDRALAIVLEEDKKPGRFFEDQPDVSDDYQMHVVYTLYKDSKDNEKDINGKLEEMIKKADDWIYKKTKKANEKSNTMNGEGQRIKWDRREDGKLDISFVRLAVTKKEMKKCPDPYGSCGNLYGRTIVNSGFNNPKKIYFNFGDFAYGEWPYSGGFPIFSVFAKHKGDPLKTSEWPYFVLHEGLHAMGGIYTCAPNYIEGHNTKKTKDLMSRQGDGTNHTLDPKNDDYWGHNIKTCPDMQDSVYFTPTSDTPFDPFEVTCLTKDKWKLTKHNYEKYMDEEGLQSHKCFYSRGDITMPWEEKLGIIKANW